MSEQDKKKDHSGSGGGMERRLGMRSYFQFGFFLLPGLAADQAGPSLPLVYLTASLLMLPGLFSLGELSSAMPRAGGPYFFITHSIGPQNNYGRAFGIYLLLLKGGGVYLSHSRRAHPTSG